MSDMITKIRQIGSKSMLPFQRGILMTCIVMKQFLPEMRSLYGLKFVMTSRLNQDCLENFFSRVRALGRTYDHPGPAEFLHRVRLLVLGQCPELVVEGTVVEFEQDEIPTVSVMSTVQQPISNNVSMFEEFENSDVVVSQTDCPESPESPAVTDCNEQALIYVCGYIAHCFRSEYPQLGTPTSQLSRDTLPPWLATVSRGGLINPAADFVEKVKQFEDVFREIHGSSVSKQKGIIKFLIQKLCSMFPDVPKAVIKKYSTTRTHARIKFLNARLREEKKRKQEERKKKQESRRSKNKTKHFTT
jgi:hypothetical protein